MRYENSLTFAQSKDEADALAKYRDDFFIPKRNGKEVIYLCGNSLGLQPKSTTQEINDQLIHWRDHGVEGHFEGDKPWVTYHKHFTRSLMRIAGGKECEVVAMNNLTTNIHFLLASFYRPEGKRSKIMIESQAFSSDIYAVNSFVKHLGLDPDDHVITITPTNGELYETKAICSTIEQNKDTLALVFLGGLNYYTGQVLNMAEIARVAHEVGAKAGFDLAHAAGNIPLELHDWNVDFAAWCTYKYLNAGPGAVSGVFIHERYARDKKHPRLAGWWGQQEDTRFEMNSQFDPTPSAEGWMVSNSSIFNMAGLLSSLKMFDQVGMAQLRKKSVELTGYLDYLLGQLDPKQRLIKMITPSNADERGCQLSMYVPKKSRLLFEYLTDHAVMLDWRRPDVIRVAPTPFYNGFTDVYNFTVILAQGMKEIYG